MKIRSFILLLVSCLLISGVSSAENTAFKDYEPKTILIDPHFIGHYESYDLDKKGMRNLIVNKIMGAKKMRVKFITFGELEDKISEFSKHDMKALKKEKPDFYQELLERYTARYIDGVLNITTVYEENTLNRLAPGQIPISGKNGRPQYNIPLANQPVDAEASESRVQQEGTQMYRNEIRQERVYDSVSGSYILKSTIVSVPTEQYLAISESKEITKSVKVTLSLWREGESTKAWEYEEERSIENLHQTPLIAVGDLFDKGMREWRKAHGDGLETTPNPGETFTGDDIHYAR
jgi:hypothetical protein